MEFNDYTIKICWLRFDAEGQPQNEGRRDQQARCRSASLTGGLQTSDMLGLEKTMDAS